MGNIVFSVPYCRDGWLFALSGHENYKLDEEELKILE